MGFLSLLLPLLLPGSARGAEPADAAAPPSWDAAVLAEAGPLVSETVVPGVPGDDGAPREGVSVRTTSFRVLETLEGQAPEGPVLIRFLFDPSPVPGFPGVDVVSGRRCLLLLCRRGPGWELFSPREGVRDVGEGGVAEARRMLAAARGRVFLPAHGTDREAVARLVESLRADAWEEREQASARLRAMGPGVVPQLRAARRGERDSEVLVRLAALDVQHWRGWYLHRERRYPFRLELTSEGEGGAFLGRGREPRVDWGPRNGSDLTFTLAGTSAPLTGRFTFCKTYDPAFGGGVWEYEGTLLNDATVHGSWGGKGWFVMWREDAAALVPDAKAAPAVPSHDGPR
jgi:hypothetical protein